MKPFIFFFLYLTIAFDAKTQVQIFDVLSCTLPQGFEVKDNKDKLHLERFEGKNYCQLFVYPVVQSNGSADKDFTTNWNFFARNAEQQVNDPETVTHDSVNNWKVVFGAARGTYNRQQFVVTVTTFTKDAYTYYVAAVFTDKKFLETAQTFSAGVVPDEKKLTQKNPKPKHHNSIENNTTTAANTTAITTQFSDGWTSTYVGPYVTVSNGNTEAWIFPVNDSLDKVGRKPDELVEDRYWRYTVNRFFQVRNVAERPWQMSGTGSDKIFEAEVKNRQTGKENFVSMRVVWNSGRAQVVLAFAATKEQMYKGVFAQYNSFEQVLPYNKFVPTKQMLLGSWQSSETGATGSYSVAGGFQGGNTKVRFKDVFTFNADGSYQSYQAVQRYVASGHDGMGRNYKGQFTVEGETLQLTGRDKEDPGVFDCWMEAVQDGLALIMINKKFTGQRYMLFREK